MVKIGLKGNTIPFYSKEMKSPVGNKLSSKQQKEKQKAKRKAQRERRKKRLAKTRSNM